MTLVAGVDSSTQSVKIVVCDADTGEVVRTARASHPPGTEVSATAWLTAWQQATADPDLLDGVAALSVGGQQHGMVTMDEQGELVRDALLWNDNRSAPDALDLIAELGSGAAWADAVGSVPVASMTVAKIRWLARAEPENAARTAAVALPHDWLMWQIAGRSFPVTTDRGDASGTCYFDATEQPVPAGPGPAGHRPRARVAPGGRAGRDRRLHPERDRRRAGNRRQHGRRARSGGDRRRRHRLARDQWHRVHHERRADPRTDRHGGRVRRRHRRLPAPGLHA